MRCCCLLGLEGIDLLSGERGEDLDIAGSVGVVDVEPELIEGIGRRALGVEPYVAALRLAEFTPVGLGDQRADEAEGFAPILAADELRPRGDIAPLVRAAHLQAAAVVAVEV